MLQNLCIHSAWKRKDIYEATIIQSRTPASCRCAHSKRDSPGTWNTISTINGGSRQGFCANPKRTTPEPGKRLRRRHRPKDENALSSAPGFLDPFPVHQRTAQLGAKRYGNRHQLSSTQVEEHIIPVRLSRPSGVGSTACRSCTCRASRQLRLRSMAPRSRTLRFMPLTFSTSYETCRGRTGRKPLDVKERRLDRDRQM